MSRQLRSSGWLIASLLALTFLTLTLWPAQPAAAVGFAGTSGSLGILGKDGTLAGACPLQRTEVRGAISGFLARVTVTQTFANSADQKIEAVYAFPLPENAAVDDMTIQVGDRTVQGVIRKREEARAIYEQAKQAGHVAALLDQERPNIFTQAVANIMPGEQVVVTISYLQTLQYEDGAYEFVFPMVVGPRYIPGQATGQQAGGRSPDTDQVPDASRITPPITPPGTRAGHDISIELTIDAGVPIQQLRSPSHAIEVENAGASQAIVQLKRLGEIPNKDFILRYDVAGSQISDAVLSQGPYAGSNPVGSKPAGSNLGPGGYFSLILQPPARVSESDVTPKELVFVVDTSGSMMGAPIEKAKQLINRALDELYPGDTFNLITFSGSTRILFPEPVYPTAENIRKARQLLNDQSGYGGTEMMKAIRAALLPSDSQDHLRVVCFVTDGYVGNDLEIIGEVQKHPNARVFAFGIGSSVNRFLIEGMAKAGRGEAEIVSPGDKADAAAHRLYERLRSPLLTDVSIDWGGLPVSDVYPKSIPDLFSGKPLVVSGRYAAAGNGIIRVRGKRAGEDFVREIPVSFSGAASEGRILPAFWARRKIDDLMSQDWAGLQNGTVKPNVQEEITQLGLDYRLMTQFTSFVAVEERVVTKEGKPVRVEVPVEMPAGVSYEGIFGDEKDKQYAYAVNGNTFSLSSQAVVVSKGGWLRRKSAGAGSGGGVGNGAGSGSAQSVAGVVAANPIVVSNTPSSLPPPPPPPNITLSRSEVEVPPTAATEEPQGERAILASKLSPAVLDALDCWKESKPGCKQAKTEMLEIQLFLKDDSSSVLERLKALGFAADGNPSKQKTLRGRLPIEKLAELAKLDVVRFVSLIGN